jgi:L-lactate dehydrogenase complex protein LldG
MPLPSSDSAAILARIREALRVAAPALGRAIHPEKEATEFRAWLPPVGEGHEERVAAFARESAALASEFHRFPNLESAREAFRALAKSEGWHQAAFHGAPLVSALIEGAPLDPFEVREGYDKKALEACPVGVTACDALVAQTGSVLVTSTSAGGRALSILPPHHLVVARAEQLVADLPEAFALLDRTYGVKKPSMISFITGPSRTGDIERILVLGAHGPKRVTIYLID